VSVGLTWVFREKLPHHFCGTDVIDCPTKDPFRHVFAAWPGMASTFDSYTALRQHSQRSSRKQDAGYLEQSESQRGFPRICFVAPSVPSIPEYLQMEREQRVTSRRDREQAYLLFHGTLRIGTGFELGQNSSDCGYAPATEPTAAMRSGS
jgi:hypothetical protein